MNGPFKNAVWSIRKHKSPGLVATVVESFNQSDLFQNRVITGLWNVFMRLAPKIHVKESSRHLWSTLLLLIGSTSRDL